MIAALLFDCFGVFTADTWNEFLASLPADVDKEAARDVHRAFDAGIISVEESQKEIKEITGKEFVELGDPRYESHKNTKLLEYIASVKNKYKLAVVSNVGSNWIRESFLTPEETELFDTFVLSYEVGTNKPDPRMYMVAAERLEVSPQACVMIDDKENYCTAAEQVGMKSVAYRDFEQFKTDIEALISSS